MTPAERRARASIAANIRWAHEDPTHNAVRGQAGLRARFERDVDPDGTLSPAERAKRAERLHRAHITRLAEASRKARAARKGGAA
jgi:hypothetical protein